MAGTAKAKAAPAQEAERPIIVRKVVEAAHAGHHGGAWKIAYADFVTAMMAFFLLMWLLGMTDEEKRKGLADYFSPTLIEYRQSSAGSTGILGGDSLVAVENYPHREGQNGSRAMVVPRDVAGGEREMRATPEQGRQFADVRRDLERRMAANAELRDLARQMRITETPEGLRIDLMDRADFEMFSLATDRLTPRAARMVDEVGRAIAPMPGRVAIRGHTDSRPYADKGGMNNWRLSSARAESTRIALLRAGVATARIDRIEGVADRYPLVPADRFDPRNRRISITLSR